MPFIEQNSLLKCLFSHIDKNQSIIKELDELSDEIFQYSKDLKASKVVATGAALIGTGVALAPVTSGLSLGISLGIIGGTIAGSTAVSIHSNIKDKQKTKQTISKIQNLVSSREDILIEEKRITDNLRECVEILAKNSGLGQEEAIRKVLLAHSKGPIEIREGGERIILSEDSRSIIPINLSTLQSSSAMNDYFNKEDNMLSHLDSIHKSSDVNLITNSTASVLNFGAEIVRTFQTPLIYLLYPVVIFVSVANVALLVKNWDKVHPTVEHIVDVKKSLCDEIEKCKTFKAILERFIAEEKFKRIDCLEEIIEVQNEKMDETKNKITKLEQESKNSKEILKNLLQKFSSFDC
jgi:hypothetical protein